MRHGLRIICNCPMAAYSGMFPSYELSKIGGRGGDNVLWEVICFSQAYGSDKLHVVESFQTKYLRGKVFFSGALFFGNINFLFPMEKYMESQSSVAS
jgi:hypothetical protein